MGQRASRGSITAAAVILGIAASRPAFAIPLDSNFVEATYYAAAGNLSATGAAFAPDGTGRLFVARKNGTVSILEPGGILVATPFVTVSPVYVASECGLIGIAFDPSFASNGYVYLFVTVSASEQQIIRYTAQGNVGVDKTVIVDKLATRGANHDGGAIGFGPDGKLYWGIGDNGNGTGVNADLTSTAAKIGRANRDGSIPNDNPFFDGPGPNNDYIWARGFRNPFTFTFQPTTEKLWVNTVGTNWEQVLVPSAGDHAGYNSYENSQPTGYLSPLIAYRTNGTQARTITASGASRSGGFATFSTSGSHYFRLGERITISGVTDASFDGTGYVAGVPSDTSFTIVQVAGDASSGGGTAVTQNLGGAITGGTFLDSTSVPADYRGDFFFADYNAGIIVRANLDASGVVTAVDRWSSGITQAVDVEIGPDGDLYLVQISGTIVRARYQASSQGLIVSRTHLRTSEGGSIGFSVRLAQAPASDVVVSVTRSAGDSSVAVSSGSSLTFTSGNWATPQPVRVVAAADTDATDDVATISVSASALTTETVTVKVTDENNLTLVLSTTTATFDEGATTTFGVSLDAEPSSTVAVDVARTAGSADVSVSQGSTLTFDASNWSTPQQVTLAAADDADTAGESATVSVSSPSLATRTVDVTVNDDDALAPTFSSTAVTTAVVGAPYSYGVQAKGLPAPTFSLDVKPTGMSIDASTGVVSWTPDTAGTVNVTVRAENGIAPAATQSFSIAVTADQAPTCVLTRPVAGEVLAGAQAEFFGDVFDDVGATKSEFFIDGTLAYTDVTPGGHVHFGGTHNQFDTTVLTDGSHLLRLAGTDTQGQTCQVEVTVAVRNATFPDAGHDASTEAGLGTGGAAVEGGLPGSGGSVAFDGSAVTGGTTGAGGTTGTGGSVAQSGAGGALGTGGGLQAASGGTGDSQSPPASVDSGCGCRVMSARDAGDTRAFLALAALGVTLARRRTSRQTRA